MKLNFLSAGSQAVPPPSSGKKGDGKYTRYAAQETKMSIWTEFCIWRAANDENFDNAGNAASARKLRR
jgi:hypothetical protein